MKITSKLLKRFGYVDFHTKPDPLGIGTIYENYLYSFNNKGIRVYFKENTNDVIIRTALSDGIILYKGKIKDVNLLNNQEFFICLIEARKTGMRFINNGYNDNLFK